MPSLHTPIYAYTTWYTIHVYNGGCYMLGGPQDHPQIQ